MRNSSKPVKILVVIVLFGVFYLPVSWLWMKILPLYNKVPAAIAHEFVNIIEFSDAYYKISVVENEFNVAIRVWFGSYSGIKNKYVADVIREGNMLSFNVSLWAALFLASIVFINRPARWKFLLIAPVILILWHVCDLVTYAKTLRWTAAEQVHAKSGEIVDYSYTWRWIWWWIFELNRRVINYFLPVLLWIILCSRSFFTEATSGGNRPGKLPCAECP